MGFSDVTHISIGSCNRVDAGRGDKAVDIEAGGKGLIVRSRGS